MKNTVLILLLIPVYLQAQDTLTMTYELADIPTSFGAYDPSCNGPNATLVFTLPAGDNYEVTHIDIEYLMTALEGGFKSHQRSYIHCQFTGISEPEYSGMGDAPGIQSYERDSVTIANGIYAGGTELAFEMRAYRTVEVTPGCNDLVIQVNAFTWIITLYLGGEILNQKVGIATDTPSQTLDVNGRLKVGDDDNIPEAGTIRWNSETEDFEGYTGTTWLSLTQQAPKFWGIPSDVMENHKVLANDSDDDDHFGISVSIWGEYAIIGAFLDEDAGDFSGSAYIFHRSGNVWTEQEKLTASDAVSFENFGRSVSIWGEYAIVGAPNDDDNGSESGSAYIFKRSGNDWTEQQKLTASDGNTFDQFGWAVDLHGDYAIIGAFHDDDDGVNSGSAYIFHRSGNNWSEQAKLTASDASIGDNFGYAVALSGNYALISAYINDDDGTSSGSAYVFKRSNTLWLEQSKLTASDAATGDIFGYSVAIEGDYLIVGAPGDESETGAAYIFKRDGGVWNEKMKLTASDGNTEDAFGGNVGIHGDYAVVGASFADTQVADTGGAYIFHRSGSIWTEQTKLEASDAMSMDGFGHSVSIWGSHIIVGAPFDADNGVNTGSWYAFH